MSESLLDTSNPGVLDLSGADTSNNFDAVDAAVYPADVWEVTWKETKGPTAENPNAKMPQGIPYLNVQFKLTREDVINRRVFNPYFPIAPPPPYDQTAAAKLQGGFVNFLVALGYNEATVKAPGFKLDLEDMKRSCFVVVSKDLRKGTGVGSPGEDGYIPPIFDNHVKGVKGVEAGATVATDAPTASAGSLL